MRGSRSVVAAAVLLLAACTGDSGPADMGAGADVPPTQTFEVAPGEDGGAPPASGGAGGGGEPGSSDGDVPDGSEGSSGEGDGSGPSSEGRGGSSGTGSGGGAQGGSESHGLSVDDGGRLGAMGAALLRPDVPRAVVEVATTPGESLTARARNALRDRLVEHGSKRSVEFVAGATLPERGVWTPSTVRATAAAHRAVFSTPERVAVFVMVVSGEFRDPDGPETDGESTPVGFAFGASSFALFVEQIPSGSLLGLSRADYEEAVAVHELGHLFGLVNLTGHGAFHEDPEHPGHSANRGSVMFWAIEQSGPLAELFEGGPPTTFDGDDRTEMERIRRAG